MLSKVLSYALSGLDGFQVEIETDISNGFVRTDIVGMGDTAVKEAKDRVNSAIENSGYTYPHGKVVVSLAPAGTKKEGSGFDLAIALGILLACGRIRRQTAVKTAIIGELSLNGNVRGVTGILPLLISAKACGFHRFIIPEENVEEAAFAGEAEIYAAGNLKQAADFLNGEGELRRVIPKTYVPNFESSHSNDFKYVKGQQIARRAIEVAVAGGHNILMIGPPGSGKTMISKCIPSIMPPMTYREALEVTKIHSIAGILDKSRGVVSVRPFRSPHHTATTVALTGGGKSARPGEISLAHNGVLFLDEMPEYARHTLETLRQPLEDGKITIARANQTVEYPAQFMLVASMNPCPCGNYGSKNLVCNCTKSQIERYMSRLSAPLLDRIDIHIHVDGVTYEEIDRGDLSESSEKIRQRVQAARQVQQERFHTVGIACNAAMRQAELAQFCKIDEDSRKLLSSVFEKLHLSARAYGRILKLARTIADLSGKETITRTHIAEAVQYRTLDRKKN